MAAFADFTTLCARLGDTGSRLSKRPPVAEVLCAVAFRPGRPFPVSAPRVLNVRGLPAPARATSAAAASGPPLTIMDVAAAFVEVAEAGGAGARRLKDERLSALAARASQA